MLAVSLLYRARAHHAFRILMSLWSMSLLVRWALVSIAVMVARVSMLRMCLSVMRVIFWFIPIAPMLSMSTALATSTQLNLFLIIFCTFLV